MRRVVRMVIACLLVGAAINVAVAWGCALWSPARSSPWVAESAVERVYPAPSAPFAARDVAECHEMNGAHRITLHQARASGFGVTMHQLAIRIEDAAPVGFRLMTACRAGWPLFSLESVTPWNGARPQMEWRWGMSVPAWLREQDWSAREQDGAPHPIPMRPVWPGFGFNTLVYGATCWMLFAGPLALRRWRRGRRGRRGVCVGCGYEIESLAVCPECGREVHDVGRDGGVGPVSGGARVAGGVAAPVVMESPSARGEEGGRDGPVILTTPEGVAYERASPLKRAGERGAVGGAPGRVGAGGVR